jgi:hypothetical protein
VTYFGLRVKNSSGHVIAGGQGSVANILNWQTAMYLCYGVSGCWGFAGAVIADTNAPGFSLPSVGQTSASLDAFYGCEGRAGWLAIAFQMINVEMTDPTQDPYSAYQTDVVGNEPQNLQSLQSVISSLTGCPDSLGLALDGVRPASKNILYGDLSIANNGT